MRVLGRTYSLCGQRGDGRRVGCQPNQRLDEEAGIGRRLGERLEDGALDSSDGPGGRLPHHLPQAAPPRWRSHIHDLANPGRAEPEQHLRGGWVMLGHEGHRRDSRKLPNQMPQRLHLFRDAPMDRDQHRVHRPLPHDPYGIGDGVPMYHRKASAASGVHPGPLDR